MLESEGGVQPSIRTLGGTMEEMEEVRDSRSSWGALCCMYSGGMELKIEAQVERVIAKEAC